MKIIKTLFYLFLISIPFGTRILLYQFTNGFHEYEAVFLYASDILMILFIVFVFAFGRRGTFKKTVSQAERAGVPTAFGTSEAESERNFHAGKIDSVFSRKFPEGTESFLIIFLFFSIVSCFLAFSKGLAIYNFARLILLVLLAFAVAKILKEGIVKLENILAIIAGSAVLQAFIGIFQFFKQSSLGLGFLGESVISQEIGGVAKIAVDGAKIIRAYGTFPHPNILAAFLILGLISFYYFWMKSTNNESVTNKRIYKFFIPIGIFIVSLGLLFTFSRTAWVLAILASIVIISISGIDNIDSRNRYFTKKNWRLAIVVFAIVSILFAAFNPYILSRAKVSGQEPSVSYRLTYNKMALEIIKKNPFGIGIGNQVLYSVKNGIYQKLGMDQAWQWQPIHNIYLLIASEIGIIGLVAFLIFIYTLFLNPKIKAQNSNKILNSNVKNFGFWILDFGFPKAMLLPLLAFGFVDHFLWTLQPGRLMFWLVIGILLASSPRSITDNT